MKELDVTDIADRARRHAIVGVKHADDIISVMDLAPEVGETLGLPRRVSHFKLTMGVDGIVEVECRYTPTREQLLKFADLLTQKLVPEPPKAA